MLKRHLAGAHKHESFSDKRSLFETIVALRTGEALLFCPTAAMDLLEMPGTGHAQLQKLGGEYIKVKIRERVTVDGGRSILASTVADQSRCVTENYNIPMHVVTRVPQSSFTFRRPGPSPSSTVAAPLPLPAPVQARSNATGQGNQPQPSAGTVWYTKGKVNKSLRCQLHREIRSQVQAMFRNNPTMIGRSVDLRTLSGNVESALNIPLGTLLRAGNIYGQMFEMVAQDEHVSFRVKTSATRS